MIKWIKKNARYFLIAFGVLLMIVFIVPQQVWQSDGSSRVDMTIDGRKVTARDSMEASRSLETYTRLAPQHASALGFGGREHDSSRLWLLLSEQARRTGLLGAAGDAEAFLADIARTESYRNVVTEWQQKTLTVPPDAKDLERFLMTEIERRTSEMLPTLRERLSRPDNNGVIPLQTLSQGRAIERLVETYRQTPVVSEARFVQKAAELFNTAEVQYIIIPVDEKTAAGRPAPSDAELTEFYNKYKDVPVGTGEFGIGYRQPNRVRLAWLKIDRLAIENAVNVDPIEVQRKVMAAKPPAGQESALRSTIESEIRTRLTDSAMGVARDAFKRYALTAVAKLPDEGIYKVLPAGHPAFDLGAAQAAVLADLADKTGIRLTTLTTGTTPTLVSIPDAAKLPDLASASIRRGTDRKGDIPLSGVLAALKEFSPKPDVSAKVRVPVQTGAPVTDPLEDFSGSLIYVCVIDSKPEASPASLDEIRAQVVQDKKKVDAMNDLATQSLAYVQAASELGMTGVESLVKQTAPDVKLVQHVYVSRANRVRAQDPTIDLRPVQVEKFYQGVMERAEKLSYKVKFDQTNALDRTFVIPLPASLSVAIVQITQFNPLTKENLRLLASGGLDNLRTAEVVNAEGGRAADRPLGLPLLTKRLNVVDVAPTKEKSKSKDAKDKDADAADAN